MMFKRTTTVLAIFSIAFSSQLFSDDNCSMQVAPSAITIGSENEPAQLTFHTDVDYSEVALESLMLVLSVDSEEVEDQAVEIDIVSTFADNLGHLVARADWLGNEDIELIYDKLKDGVIEIEFELSGTADEQPFECEDEIRVISVKKDK